MSHREQYQPQHGAYVGPVPLKSHNFPHFNDGDVKIIITGSRQYQLHSSILKISSSVLSRLLDDQFTAKLTKSTIKKGVVVRNRLVGMKNTDPALDVDLVLEPVRLDTDGKPPGGSSIGLDLENGMVVPPVHVAYDIVFGAFYNRAIELGEFGRSSLGDILEMALEVIRVAEYLDVIDMITKPFEATLLSTGQTLHQSIASDPGIWLDFAYRIRSKVIFREALIHAAGQYNTPMLQQAMKENMKKSIASIVDKRGKILLNGVKTSLRKILSYYPPNMQRSRTLGLADIDHIGRSSYSNDIMSWMALTVFRHYISQHVANDQTHHADDMGYELISVIAQGGDQYLDKDALNSFHQLFPMSGRGAAVVESKLADIKEEVKKFIFALTKNNSQLDTTRAAHKYFTCANVEHNDYPWLWTAQPEDKPINADDDEQENDSGVESDENGAHAARKSIDMESNGDPLEW